MQCLAPPVWKNKAEPFQIAFDSLGEEEEFWGGKENASRENVLFLNFPRR